MPLWSDLQLRPEVHLLEELDPRPLVNREARDEAKIRTETPSPLRELRGFGLRSGQSAATQLNREGAKGRRFK